MKKRDRGVSLIYNWPQECSTKGQSTNSTWHITAVGQMLTTVVGQVTVVGNEPAVTDKI